MAIWRPQVVLTRNQPGFRIALLRWVSLWDSRDRSNRPTQLGRVLRRYLQASLSISALVQETQEKRNNIALWRRVTATGWRRWAARSIQ